MSDLKNLVVTHQNDITVASFTHSKLLDETNIHAIGKELLDIVNRDRGVKLLINFDSVEYLSSAVLGKLMAIHKATAANKGKLVLCGISASIFEVFKITKLDKLFTIETDAKAGLASFEKKKSWFK